MERINPEFALYVGTNERARTDTVFLPIFQVCSRGVSAKSAKYIHYLSPKEQGVFRSFQEFSGALYVFRCSGDKYGNVEVK